MKTELETSTAARAEFDRAIVSSGILNNEKFDDTSIETLYGVFWAGVSYGISTQRGKALESPLSPFKGHPAPDGQPRKVWPRRKPGEVIEVKDPGAPATDKQYQYLKKLKSANPAKANAVMTREEYDVINSDIGGFTKGQASDLIDRLIKAGIVPKRSR